MINIENVPIEKLNPAPYNPRDISNAEFDKLVMSIRENGIVEPLVINKDMTIIGGNQRFKALVKLKYKSAPCVVVNMSKDREKALNLALNKISGDWNQEKLAELIIELNDIKDFDLNLTGFDAGEIDIFLKDLSKNNKDLDEVPELPDDKPPVTQIGDIYSLGKHRVMCGDSTKAEDVERLRGGNV